MAELSGLDRWIYDHVLAALDCFDEPANRRRFEPYEYVCHGDQELFFVIVRRLEAEGDCVLFFTFANLLGNVPDGERAEWDPADPDSFFAGFRVHMEAEGYEYVSAHLLSEPEEGKWAGRALELTESIGGVSLAPPPGYREHRSVSDRSDRSVSDRSDRGVDGAP
jgi:hypothetical protein